MHKHSSLRFYDDFLLIVFFNFNYDLLLCSYYHVKVGIEDWYTLSVCSV